MRYTAEHKEETRRRIVEAAGAIAKKQGFGTTGVDGLMGAAGLKGSSFYHHFSTKGELLKDIIEHEIEGSRKLLMGRLDGSKTELVRQVRSYMSTKHLDNAELGCVLPRLSSEVARADDSIKHAYEDALSKMQEDMGKIVGGDTAWAVIALSVGALVLAGGMASKATQKELLKACYEFTAQAVDAAEPDSK
jgi:TetR/AcrR family transcriptional repressor of nem operon